MTAGQPPREALAAVERCLEAAGCPDAACDARELFRLATGRDPPAVRPSPQPGRSRAPGGGGPAPGRPGTAAIHLRAVAVPDL